MASDNILGAGTGLVTQVDPLQLTAMRQCVSEASSPADSAAATTAYARAASNVLRAPDHSQDIAAIITGIITQAAGIPSCPLRHLRNATGAGPASSTSSARRGTTAAPTSGWARRLNSANATADDWDRYLEMSTEAEQRHQQQEDYDSPTPEDEVNMYADQDGGHQSRCPGPGVLMASVYLTFASHSSAGYLYPNPQGGGLMRIAAIHALPSAGNLNAARVASGPANAVAVAPDSGSRSFLNIGLTWMLERVGSTMRLWRLIEPAAGSRPMESCGYEVDRYMTRLRRGDASSVAPPAAAASAIAAGAGAAPTSLPRPPRVTVYRRIELTLDVPPTGKGMCYDEAVRFLLRGLLTDLSSVSELCIVRVGPGGRHRPVDKWGVLDDAGVAVLPLRPRMDVSNSSMRASISRSSRRFTPRSSSATAAPAAENASLLDHQRNPSPPRPRWANLRRGVQGLASRFNRTAAAFPTAQSAGAGRVPLLSSFPLSHLHDEAAAPTGAFTASPGSPVGTPVTTTRDAVAYAVETLMGLLKQFTPKLTEQGLY